MKIANLRFYSPGDDSSGAGAPPEGKPDGQEPPETKDDPAGDVTDERITKANREAASYRTKLREAETKLTELQTQIEEATSTGQSESEKVKSQLAKLQEQLKQEKAARLEAERLRMAQSAASRYDVPEEFLPALRGDTQDEIDESAKALQKVFLAAAKKLAQTVPPNPEGGDKSSLTHAANGKLTAEQQAQNRREYAQKF